MKWIASFLDAIFANIFAERKFFARIVDKVADSVEEFAYNVEAGNTDVLNFSKTMERLLFWLPIVFVVFFLLDLFIRSRFVRYSYQDENQAKKSVWWRWQSETDAALALEAGNNAVQALTDGTQAEAETEEEPQQSGMTDEVLPEEEAEAQQAAEAEAQEGEEAQTDRGMVTSARQNQVRNVAPAAERAHDAMTDLHDQWIMFKGALAFAPRAMKRNARLRKQSMQEEARHSRERWNERLHQGHNAKQREESAAAEAMFGVQAPESYIDADFEANEAVNTGGIEGVDFATAAEVMQAAVQEQQAVPTEVQDEVQDEAQTEAQAEPVAEETVQEETVQEETVQE